MLTDRQRAQLSMFGTERGAGPPVEVEIARVDRGDDDFTRRRVYYSAERAGTIGVDRRVTVYATFTGADGLTIDGYDSVEWPARDLDWTVRVTADQAENLRLALGVQSVGSIADAVACRFEDGTFAPVPSGLDEWLAEHGVMYSRSEKWHDN